MQNRLFEVACGYVLQTPAIHALAKRLNADPSLSILRHAISFSNEEMASICQEAWWRSFATLFCALAQPERCAVDERVTQELREAFSELYFSSFAVQQEISTDELRALYPSLAEGTLTCLQDGVSLFFSSNFSSFDSSALLDPDLLPSTGTIRQLLEQLLRTEYPQEMMMVALCSHKKLLEYTMLYFLQRRLQQEKGTRGALAILNEEGLRFSLEDARHVETQIRENLLRRCERFAQEERDLQQQLTEASQSGDFAAAQSLLTKMAKSHEAHQQSQALLSEIPHMLAEAQVNWQSMVGDFTHFADRLGDLFEALHASLFSPDDLLRPLPQTEEETTPPTPEVVLQKNPPPVPEALSGDEFPYAVSAPTAPHTPQDLPSLLQAHVKAYLDTHLESLIEARVEALVEARIEARWETWLASQTTSAPSPTPPPTPDLVPTAEPTTTTVEAEATHEALSTQEAARVTSKPQILPPGGSISVEAPLVSGTSETSDADDAEVEALASVAASASVEDPLDTHDDALRHAPTLRECCYRVAVEHRLWVEVDEASHSEPIHDLTTLAASQSEATLDALKALQIHGRSKASKVLETLEEIFHLPLRLLTSDGELAAPDQSSKSLRVTGGKWAFTTGNKLFLVLKPPPKEGAATSWRKYRALTFGKAFSDFFANTESRPVQISAAKGMFQAHYDHAKHRLSRVGDFLDAHPELQGHDVLCLTEQAPDLFLCEIVFQSLTERLASPDLTTPPTASLEVADSVEALPLLALQHETEANS